MATAYATDSEIYGPNDYFTIAHGLAPDHRLSIATHDYNSPNIVYLMREPSHKKIDPLEEIKDILDDGHSSFRASWAPDSRHVTINHRVDRHEFEVKLYRITNGRAYIVTGPDIFTAAADRAGASTTNWPNSQVGAVGVRWLSDTMFELKEYDSVKAYSLAYAHPHSNCFRMERTPDIGVDGRKKWGDHSRRVVYAN